MRNWRLLALRSMLAAGWAAPSSLAAAETLIVDVAQEPVDLELTKASSTASPEVGETFTYVLTLINTSSTHTTGVEVTDRASAGLQVLGGATGTGTFRPDTGVWSVGVVRAGAAVTLQVDAVAEESGELTNVAEVTAADQPDADSTPNNGDPTEDDQVTTTVTAGTPSPSPSDEPTVTDTASPEAPPSGTSDPADEGPGQAEPDADTVQRGELPRSGLWDDPWATAAVAWSLLAAGFLLLTAGHRLDRRERIRAINLAHGAMLRAQRTGELWLEQHRV